MKTRLKMCRTVRARINGVPEILNASQVYPGEWARFLPLGSYDMLDEAKAPPPELPGTIVVEHSGDVDPYDAEVYAGRIRMKTNVMLRCPGWSTNFYKGLVYGANNRAFLPDGSYDEVD